jgi:hypothetical protein
MFIGHYGAALAAKRVAPRTSLGVLFVAVQLLDILFAGFVLGGVEKLRIVPGFTKVTPYELYFMPYSHSLAGAVLFSALAALGYGLVARGVSERRGRVLAALAVGGAVLSHFVLDFPVHTPDLPLGFDPDSLKVGLGLWNQPDVTLALELGVLVAGAALYLGVTVPIAGRGTALRVVGVVLVGLTIATPFLPAPGDATAFALQALGAYAALALLAEWVDRSRAPAV